MTKEQKLVGALVSFIKLGAGAALALCLVQCSSEQQATDEPEAVASMQQGLACGGVPCSTVNDCTNAANWPLCAKIGSAQCFAAPNGCTYQLKTDPSCPCIERDVRLCNVNPTTPG